MIRMVACVTVLLLMGAVFPHGAFASKPTIYSLDLRYTSGLSAAQRYDIRHTAVCVQGLANRQAPRVFLKFIDGDVTWLNRLREPGGLCEGWNQQDVTNIYQLISLFRSHINGVVLYDPDPNTGVISTSLVATTVAGVEGGIAVRKDTSSGSMYNYLVGTLSLPVLVDLTGKFTGSGTIWQTSTPSTGSRKCDAYIWAKQKYIDAGKCNPTVLSYTLDLWGLKVGTDMWTQLSNLDYAIQQRGFCFELSPWADEPPNDDPTQPLGTDLATFKSILHSCNIQTGQSKMIKFCGFTNWHFKYTSYIGGSHGEVATETEMMRICTAYNAYTEADAPGDNWVVNGSFYAGLMPEVESRRYTQNPPPTYDDIVSRGLIDGSGAVIPGNYIMIGLGDYDSAAWVLSLLAGAGGRYDDPVRGQIYCNWAVDPNLVDRACVAVDYMYRNKTQKDYFVAWDSGAGYVFPSQLYAARDPSGYPSGVSVWQRHCRDYYRTLDYSITGWLGNGYVPATLPDYQIYTPFSGDGIGSHMAADESLLVHNVACNRMRGDIGLPNPNAVLMDQSTGVNLGWYRSVIWFPTGVQELQNRYANFGHNHRFLDAYTYYYLLRYMLSGNQQSSNFYRATWVCDTIPRIMAAGRTYPATVTVRNDGWDAWSEVWAHRLGQAIVPEGVAPTFADYDSRGRAHLSDGALVLAGQTTTFEFNITAPVTNGRYDLYYDMVRDGVTWFRGQNNIEWKKEIVVATNETDVDTDGDGMPDVTEEAQGRLWWHPDDADTTPPTTPGTPTDSGSYTSSTSLTFNWTASIDLGSGVAGYNCQIGTSPGASDVFNGYVGNVTSKTVTGSHGNTYYCRVQARDNLGNLSSWSASSNGIMVDTVAPSAPGVPTDIGAYSTSPTITFNWSPVSDSGSGIQGYYCQIGTSPGAGNVFNGYLGSITSKSVTGSYGNIYYCRAQARDNAGNLSPWSASSDGIAIVHNSGISISTAKSLADGVSVGLSGKRVTAVYGDCFYVSESIRVVGLRVVPPTPPVGLAVGKTVDVGGTMKSASNAERFVEGSVLVH